jgi:hypothetical protein
MIERAASLLLFAAALTGWLVASGARPAARVHVRFAAILFAAIAVATLAVPQAVPAIVLLVLPTGTGVLALAAVAAVKRPLESALAASLLAAVSLAALAAAVTGWSAFALAPAALCAAAFGVVTAKTKDRLGVLQGTAASICFLGAASAFALDGSGPALALFCAAGLLGITLALARSGAAVEERTRRDLRDGAAISRG